MYQIWMLIYIYKKILKVNIVTNIWMSIVSTLSFLLDVCNNSSSGFSDEGQSPSQTSAQEGASGARVRRPRTQAKWLTNTITIIEIDDDGMPMEKKALQRLQKITCLNALERVSLILPKFDDLTVDQRTSCFVMVSICLWSSRKT